MQMNSSDTDHRFAFGIFSMTISNHCGLSYFDVLVVHCTSDLRSHRTLTLQLRRAISIQAAKEKTT